MGVEHAPNGVPVAGPFCRSSIVFAGSCCQAGRPVPDALVACWPRASRTSRRGMTRGTARGALELGALGVVFGDIGTSPLYTVQTVFSSSDPHAVKVSAANVYGVVSLIFWAVISVV